MTLEEMRELAAACSYKPGWSIHVFTDVDGRPYLQLSCTDSLCSVSGVPTSWKSGKTYLSRYMCRQEIVSAVFGAIMRAEEHETREWFRYKGASIFNPHLDPDALAVLARKRSSFNLRENAMTMEEPNV